MAEEKKTKKITEPEVQDALYELIQNNSNIEGDDEDSLAFTGVKDVSKSGSNRVFVDMEDGTEVEISIRVR